MSTVTGIGYSPLTEKIYIGKQNQDKGMWVGGLKRDITNQFIDVCFKYFEPGYIREIESERPDGTKHENFFMNVANDKKSIEAAIKALKEKL